MLRQAAQFHKERLAGVPWWRWRKTGKIFLPILAILIAVAWAYAAGKLPWTKSAAEKAEPPAKKLAVERVKDKPNSLCVPEEVQRALGILKGNEEQIAVAEPPTRQRPW